MSETTTTLVTMDHYAGYSGRAREHAYYQKMPCLPDGSDTSIREAVETMLAEIGAVSGDEYEITIRKTGRRPFGDRRIVLQEPHKYGFETDEQLAARLDETQGGRTLAHRPEKIPAELGRD